MTLAPLQALRRASESFDQHDGFLLAGGIAFFSMLSLAPTLVVALGLAGLLLGDEAVSGLLERELEPVLGEAPAAFLTELVQRSGPPEAGGVAALLGSLLSFYAATRVFVELRNALHRVWDIRLEESGRLRQRVLKYLYDRVVAFLLVMLLGVLLAALVAAEATLQWLAQKLGAGSLTTLLRIGDVVLGYTTLTALVSAIYRVLSGGRVRLVDALRGAALTAFLLGAGGVLIGLYLRLGFSYSVYGAAGSFAALMLASYYAAAIFIFGAELTRA